MKRSMPLFQGRLPHRILGRFHLVLHATSVLNSVAKFLRTICKEQLVLSQQGSSLQVAVLAMNIIPPLVLETVLLLVLLP